MCEVKTSLQDSDIMGFLDIFNRGSLYPIFRRICDFLSIGEILALQRTCTAWKGLYQYFLQHEFNINRRLGRFLQDPISFRCQLGRSNALISGSFALQFFERVLREDSMLDIFVQNGQDAEGLKNHLLVKEGLVGDGSGGSGGSDHDYANPDVVNVSTFRKTIPKPLREVKIHVICTKGLPIQAILRGFHTTVLTNVISWNKAYAIYPKLTFLDHRGYMFRRRGEAEGGFAAKYEQRGWTYDEVHWPLEDPSKYLLQSPRRIGDRHTWKIMLDTENVTVPQRPLYVHARPDYVLEHAQFGIEIPQFPATYPMYAKRNFKFYPIAARPFTACSLKYAYTTMPRGWQSFLSTRLIRHTIDEILKLHPTERTAHPILQEYVDKEGVNWNLRLEDIHGFELPASWTYYDDEIPGLYHEWEQTQIDQS